MTPDDVRAAVVAVARAQGCTCSVEVEMPAGPVRFDVVQHCNVFHDDACPLIRARARHLN